MLKALYNVDFENYYTNNGYATQTLSSSLLQSSCWCVYMWLNYCRKKDGRRHFLLYLSTQSASYREGFGLRPWVCPVGGAVVVWGIRLVVTWCLILAQLQQVLGLLCCRQALTRSSLPLVGDSGHNFCVTEFPGAARWWSGSGLLGVMKFSWLHFAAESDVAGRSIGKWCHGKVLSVREPAGSGGGV